VPRVVEAEECELSAGCAPRHGVPAWVQVSPDPDVVPAVKPPVYSCGISWAEETRSRTGNSRVLPRRNAQTEAVPPVAMAARRAADSSKRGLAPPRSAPPARNPSLGHVTDTGQSDDPPV